jgi:hypothetical protein
VEPPHVKHVVPLQEKDYVLAAQKAPVREASNLNALALDVGYVHVTNHVQKKENTNKTKENNTNYDT